MAMTLKREEAVSMALPSEVLTCVADIVRRNPSAEILSIVKEVIETMAGKDPSKLLALFKAAGGPSELIQQIDAEARRLKSIGHGKT
jgi:hypothetical protein